MRRLLQSAAGAARPVCRCVATSARQQGSTKRSWVDVLPQPAVRPSSSTVSSTHSTPLPPPTSSLLSQFYQGLATHDIERVWPLYHAIYQQQRLNKLSRQNFRSVLQIVSRGRASQMNLNRLLTVVADMERYQVPLRRSDYHAIMRWVGGRTVPETRPRHVSDALSWLTLMERPSLAHQPAIQPQLVTYNILIHTAAMARDILTAQRLYHSMLAKGIRADEYTYTTLLHCMAAMGDDHGVDDMLTHIQRDGNAHLLQNTVTWNVLLTCYYPTHPEKADNMFHRMCDALTGRTMGSECTETTETAEKDDPLHAAPPADGTTFQLHLDQLLDRHDYDTAVQIVLETMVPFCPPPLALYHRLFDTLKPSNALVDRAHGLALLHQLVPSLKMIDITPVTLDTLIHALLDHGDTVFALETFVQLCQQHNITPHQPLLDRLHTVIQRMS